ncbi:peptide MFS transporter [Pedobacter puniceum]|jgi:POT family proton-dependent oligopeptide transporter|uniref:MFS transporter n=1 Tax=Pedobacter puniceum TaxID=2666136 RepID=A0A7K0FTM0_9SPHI|nr:peptide MFS transporter [Pedobacter puniceum]MRX48477.1 MFS transporter [Pedobacter puniceum]
MEKQKELFGHPIGLYILFLTEMWERFSYYGMRAILVLYLVAKTSDLNAGLGWTEGEAYALYGWYTMFVYVASIPGGIIADKYLGQKKSVMLGGWLLVAGHGILAIEQMWAFYTGLILIVAGVGCLKPNISTMVGGLYANGDRRKDMGFYIFYMGINLGAAISALAVGYVGETYGWHYGFGMAGVGMALGQMVYLYGQKYLTHVGDLAVVEKTSGEPQQNLFLDIFKKKNSLFSTLAVLALGLVVFATSSWQYGLLIMGLSFAVGVAMVMYNECNAIEKDRMKVVFLSFLIIIVFWGAFEQAGGLMNVYADQKTNRMIGLSFLPEVPASWFQSVNAIFILLFATLVGTFWIKWAKAGKEASSIFKMAVGVIIMGSGFLFMTAAALEYQEVGKSAMHWLILAYLFHTIGELCASPVALSFITKLSPERYVAFMMGAYFAATGLGNKVAGILSEASAEAGELTIFAGIAIFCVLFGLLVFLIIKPLKRLTHGAEEGLEPATH